MSANIPINRNAMWPVRRSTTGSLPVGRGCLLTGSYAADGSFLVIPPMGADGLCTGVIFETDIDDTTTGLMAQVGVTNVQVRIGATAVSKGDKLNLQDNTGVWQPASAGAQNVYYISLQNAAAGALCWVMPIASRPL